MSPLQKRLKTQNPRKCKFTRVFVKAEGFEPSTACLEGRCSIQLSYATIRIPLIIHKLYVVKSTLSTKALNNFLKINFL